MACEEPEPETKPSKKTQRTVLDSFDKLNNPNEPVRIKSGLNLLKHLQEIDENEKEKEMEYALKRLIRGLAAPKIHARTGFYTVLVGLLQARLDITLSEVLEALDKYLQTSKSINKSEKADVFTGRVLLCGAIIRSKLFLQGSEEEQVKVLEALVKAGKARAYLSLPAYTFLIDLCQDLTADQYKQIVLPVIKEDIYKPLSELTIDSLYLLLVLKEKFPKCFNKKAMKSTFGSEDLVIESNLTELTQILTTIPNISYLKHPIYSLIPNYIPSSLIKSFANNLNTVLQKENRNKYLITIEIIRNLLKIEDSSLIPNLLTDNLITAILTSFKSFVKRKNDPELARSAHSLFDGLVSSLEKASSETKIAVLRKLLFKPGTFIFEKITHSKLVQQITSSLDVEGIKALSNLYESVIKGEELIDSQFLNNDKLYASHLLVKLLNYPVMKEQNDWKVEKLLFLLDLSFFEGKIGSELAVSIRATFFGALQLKQIKLEELRYILYKIVKHLEANIDKPLRNALSFEAKEIWIKTLELIEKLQKKKKGVKAVFSTLFLHLGLQLFNDVKLAADSLNELFNCFDRLDKSSSNEDPEWIEVVIDLFLSLLSQNKALLRNLIKIIFPYLCQHLTANAIHQIVSVLDPKNSNPLSLPEEESDLESGDDEEESDSSEEEEDDEEENETENDKLRMALHQVLIKDADVSDIDLDELSESEGLKLDEALAEAFKQHKPNKGKTKKQSRDEESLTHFRVRVLDLVEIYLDSNPAMELVLEVMLPLLQALEFSIRDEHQVPLNNRLKACLKKLWGLKKFSSTGVSEEVLLSLLKSLLDKKDKPQLLMQEMGEQISDCAIFVLKCSMLEEVKASKSLFGFVSEQLDAFFVKNDYFYVFFKNVMQLATIETVKLVRKLLQVSFDDSVKAFKRNQALELLKLFFANQRFLNAFADKISKKLQSNMSSFFDSALGLFEKQEGVKEKFVGNLFGVLQLAKSGPVQFDLDWGKLGETVREFRSHVTFSKDAKLAFNKLCGALGVSHVVKMKDKVVKLNDKEEGVGEEEGEKVEGKKKKRKAGKDKLKMKKEAKELRLKSLSEGLVGFVGGVEEVEDEEEKEEEEVEKKKRKKNGVEEVQNGLEEAEIKQKKRKGEGVDGSKKKKKKVKD